MTGLAQTGLPVTLPIIGLAVFLYALDALVRWRRREADAHANWMAHLAELQDETDRHLEGRDGL